MFNLSTEVLIISLLIIFLVFGTMVQWLTAYQRLKQEQKVVRRIANAPAPTTKTAALELLNTNSESPAIQVFERAVAMGQIDTLLLNYDMGIFWPRYLAGIFVFLGLLGTVLGLGLAVYQLGGTLQHTEQLDLEQVSGLQTGIASLLTNMYSAFVCTFVGLVSTIFVSALNSQYLSTSEDVTALVYQVASVRMLPVYAAEQQRKEEQKDRQLFAMIRALGGTATSLDGASRELAKQLSPATERLIQVVDNVNQTGQQMVEASRTLRAEGERLEKRHLQQENWLQSAIDSHQVQQKALESSTQQFKVTADSLTLLVTEIRTQREENGSITQQVALVSKAAMEAAEQLKSGLLQLGEKQESRLQEWSTAMGEAQSALVGRIESHFVSIQDRQNKQTEEQSRAFAALGTELNRILIESQNGLQKTLEFLSTQESRKLEALTKNFGNRVMDLVTQLKAESSANRNQWEENLDGTATQLQRIIDNFERTVTVLLSEHEQERHQQSELNEQFVKRIEGVQTELSMLLRLFERSLLDFATIPLKNTNQVQDSMGDLQQELQSLRSDMSTQRSAHQEKIDSILLQIDELELNLRKQLSPQS